MSAPLPPPPPPPPLAMGVPPPPPPPSLPARPGREEAQAQDRSALFQDITKGTRLKKTVTNDRSGPMITKEGGKSSGPAVGGAPPVPGLFKAPGLAPPVPIRTATSRLRSNSDGGSSAGSDSGASGFPSAPQLGGLFAGGIPKLRSRGGVDTGANRDAAYLSDSDASTQQPSATLVPKPPGVPRLPGPRPPLPPSTESASAAPTNLLVANLRRPPRPISRPSSTISLTSTKTTPELPVTRIPPPVPVLAKPPLPPVSSRKPSTHAPPPPSPLVPISAPAPPSSHTPKPPTPAPPPPAAAPPSLSNGIQAIAASIAVQAARNAFENSNAPSAPPAPPPPPPMSSAPIPPPPPPNLLPAAPASPLFPPSRLSPKPMPASSNASSNDHQAKPLARQTLDPSAYTLANGGSSASLTSRKQGIIGIEDSRFRFPGENQFPVPRPFFRETRRYRAGRVSSVPLDLDSLR